MTPFEHDSLKEKVETLVGSRNSNRGRAAVRIDDLSELLQIANRLRAKKAAGTTPTKAEFDDLVDDVATINNRLQAVAKALQGRLLP